MPEKWRHGVSITLDFETSGGSHAQRDIIDSTITEAALRGGLNDLAEAMAHERLALKPHSPVNRNFLSRAKASKTANQMPIRSQTDQMLGG